MIFLMIVGAVLSLVCFVCVVWLTVLAFRQSAIWGIVTLLVPFGNVVFSIKHWQEARKPFLAWACCLVLSVVSFVGAGGMAASEIAQQVMADSEFQQSIDTFGSMKFDDVAQSPELPPEITERIEPRTDGLAPVPAPEPSIDVAYSTHNAARQPALDAAFSSVIDGNTIRLNHADRFIGSRVRIVRHSHIDSVATLISASRGSLVFEKNLGGGVASFELAKPEIKSLELVSQ